MLPWILATALAADPSPAERQAIERVVDRQIAAFQQHDAAGAWQWVSPGLQAKFGTADTFLRMVRDHYQPVYDPQSYTFGPIEAVGGDIGQWLDVVGPDGQRVGALYLMEQQADGSWRTNGCLLFAPDPGVPRT